MLHEDFFNLGWFLFFLVKNIKFIILFYVHQFILIPKFFSTGQYRKYIFYGLSLVALLLVVHYIAEHYLILKHHTHFKPALHPTHHAFGHGHNHRPRFKGPFGVDDGMHFFMTIIIAILPLLLHLYQNWVHIGKVKTEMELSFLKSQINHHFLFNALNSIYVLSIQNKPQTSDSIHSLSFIMRYILDESEKPRTLLTKELEYLHHYIELQRLRLNEKVELNYKVLGDPKDLTIAPMMLIPFIENCFKHGLSTIKKCAIDILIQIENDELIMKTENDIVTSRDDKKSESGIGIANVTRRLEFEYLNNYTLSNAIKDSKYFTSLKLNLS